jgi:Rrf2 family protein
MRVSAKGDYAIRAMTDLALEDRGDGQDGAGPRVPIQDVARRQGIPQRYLEQVLLLLKRAGFLDSKRGSTGGYRLARSPGAISVGDVLRAVEGRLTPLEIAGHDARLRRPGPARGGPGRTGAGDLAELWAEMAEAVARVVDNTTVADLAERVRARRAGAPPMYHI